MTITEAELLDLISKETGIERALLVPDELLTTIGISSPDVVSLILTLEDKYGLCFDPINFEGARTLGDVVTIVCSA